MPQVSILCPSYNHERFIGECIESALVQSFTDWELIVVDDGSSDGTREVVRALEDDRIRLVEQEHAGINRLAETYNRGLEACSGSLIAILEGDDWWPAEKLSIQVGDFDDPEVVLSSGRYVQVFPEGREELSPMPDLAEEALRNEPVGSAARAMLHPQKLTFTFPVTVVMRRSALEEAGGFAQIEGLPLVDYPTFLELTVRGRWRFHEKVLGYWRRHEASVTKSNLPRIIDGCYRVAQGFAGRHSDVIGDPAELNAAWRDMQLLRLMALAVLAWRTGDRPRARQALDRAVKLPTGARTAAMLRAASMGVSVGISPESTFRRFGRGGYAESVQLPGGERLVDEAYDPALISFKPF